MKQTKTSFFLLFLLISLIISLLYFPVHATSTETLYPNAVGDSSQNTPTGDTPGWKCVDEAVSDNDTTYVCSSDFDANPYLDLYNLVDTAIPSGSTINSVTVKVNIRSGLTAAKATFRIALKKSGSATVYGSSIQPPLSYTVYSQVFAGIALSDLNALQIGIEITSKWYGVWDTFIPGLCTQVWVVIDYTEAQQGTNLTLNGSITATFSVLSQKTASFTKNLSITETFNLQHLKSVNFLRASTITLTIGIGGLFSYWTLTSLNLFGLIPITFSTFHIPTYTLTIKKDIVVSFTLSSDYSFPFNVPSTITFTLSPASNLVETFIHSWIRTAPILYVAIGIAIIILCLGLGMEKKKRHV